MLDPKAEATAAPFQWGLLAWAALVGLSTGFAIVGFHYLLGFINNLIYGPFVAFVIDAVGPHPMLPEVLPPPTTGGYLHSIAILVANWPWRFGSFISSSGAASGTCIATDTNTTTLVEQLAGGVRSTAWGRISWIIEANH